MQNVKKVFSKTVQRVLQKYQKSVKVSSFAIKFLYITFFYFTLITFFQFKLIIR